MLCEHEGCVCETETVVKEGRSYCSEWCAAAPEDEQEACECGHSECEQAGEALGAP